MIRTVSLPVEPVAQTVVYWQSGSEQTLTDQQGIFELLLPTDRDGWLVFSHRDFHSDSVFVNWPANKELKVDVYLNALPWLDSLAVYSVVLNRFPSFQKEQLIIEHDRIVSPNGIFLRGNESLPPRLVRFPRLY